MPVRARYRISAAFVAATIALGANAQDDSLPAEGQASLPNVAVESVDLERYAGKWYEQARLPQRFQEKCVGDVTADYALNPDGTIAVTNRCRTEDGSFDESDGVARRVDGSTSMLEVRFAPAWLGWLPMVWGDYWVIDLDPEYRWAMVGAPDADYLWILSREPRLDEDVVQRLLDRADAMGYPVEDVIRTRQTSGGDGQG